MPCSEEQEKQPITLERLQREPKPQNFCPDWLGFDLKRFSVYSSDIHETFERFEMLEISILFLSLNL